MASNIELNEWNLEVERLKYIFLVKHTPVFFVLFPASYFEVVKLLKLNKNIYIIKIIAW